MQISFYPTDASYSVREEKPVIRLFGRSEEGELVCIEDEFWPYFTITGDPDESEILALQEGEYKVVRIERKSKRINEEEKSVIQVYVNLPKAVPALSKAAKDVPGVEKTYEYDILFTRRYLIDKNITPLELTHAECERVQSELKVPCYLAKKIWQEQKAISKPRILSIDIETYSPNKSINPKKNPILMIGLYGTGFSKVITWKKFPNKSKNIEFADSEADMIERMKKHIAEYSPDFITGYYTDGFDFPYLAERAKSNKIKLDIGLDGSPVKIKSRGESEAKIAGIAHIDILKFIRRVIGRSLETDSYSLDAVSEELLGERKLDINMEEMFKAWDEGSCELEKFAEYNLRDCKLTYDLTLKILPSLIEFVRLIGLSPYEINRMSFSQLVEWYLIRKASGRGEIILNKPSNREQAERMREHVQGAFVFEPKPGLYKNIAIFDYRSLYPSIIASHNISRGTFNCPCCAGDENSIGTERGELKFCTKKRGLFSETIRELILLRARIKKELKEKNDPLLRARVDALKVLANSFYGYMGFAPSRWYCIECAEATTAWARKYIHDAIDEAQNAGFTVLYSDTDSVFLLLGEKTREDAQSLARGINKKLPELMELEYEGYYPAGLFVALKGSEGGAKKKYALLGEDDNITIKGFETVRRNWSTIAKETQQKVLEIILKEKNVSKAKEFVKDTINKLRENSLPIEKVVIRTQLSRSTQSYSSIGPHVAAAKMLEERGERVGAGTIVSYVVTKGSGRIRDKVRLPDEIEQREYDGEYYVQNQIIPGVERIFSALGIDSQALLADVRQKTLGSF
ncbi:hypothetical protein D6825_03555 [Candidatus Woesearchaeota archaeon]|nr:MAG: hypothetical protein D6825_03555 [Candidatus Woesearchaeota archaeon]